MPFRISPTKCGQLARGRRIVRAIEIDIGLDWIFSMRPGQTVVAIPRAIDSSEIRKPTLQQEPAAATCVERVLKLEAAWQSWCDISDQPDADSTTSR